MDELYTAEKGGGAWLNDRRRLRVAGRKSLADAVICTGIKTAGHGQRSLQLRQLAHIDPAVAGIRRCGSISIDYGLARRRPLRRHLGTGLAWDVAPGLLMVKEAGGFVSDLPARPAASGTARSLLATRHPALLLKAPQSGK